MRNFCFIIGTLFLFFSCTMPEVSFEAEVANTSQTPVQVTFTNNSQGSASYIWYFGDGTVSSEENPVHNYNLFGNIPVILEGKKGNKIARDTQIIMIPEPPRKKVKIETPFGNMIAELYNTTPKHRDNFYKLASENFYDSLLFHRVINGFMIQGGDPDSRNAPPEMNLGNGGPGYTLPAEIGAPHYKGSLAAARLGDNVNPNRESSGSQFYIVHGRTYSSIELSNMGSKMGVTYNQAHKDMYAKVGGTPFLDNEYTVFGQVIEGMEVVDKIAAVQTRLGDRPIEDVHMKVSIIEE